MQEELPNSDQLDMCLICLSQIDKQAEWDLKSLFATQESQATVGTWRPELHACPAGNMVPHQESPDTNPTTDARSEGATQQRSKRNTQLAIPHKIIERQHRARFNTQLSYLKETLREELSASDLEDLWCTKDKEPTKGKTIEAATKHLQEFRSRLRDLKLKNEDLVYRIKELQKLAESKDCPIVAFAGMRTSSEYDW